MFFEVPDRGGENEGLPLTVLEGGLDDLWDSGFEGEEKKADHRSGHDRWWVGDINMNRWSGLAAGGGGPRALPWAALDGLVEVGERFGW